MIPFGFSNRPTLMYRLGNHSEAVEIWFDPRVVSFRRILDTFWRIHTPSERNSSQYKYQQSTFSHWSDLSAPNWLVWKKSWCISERQFCMRDTMFLFLCIKCTKHFLNLLIYISFMAHSHSTRQALFFFYLSSIKLKLFYLLYWVQKMSTLCTEKETSVVFAPWTLQCGATGIHLDETVQIGAASFISQLIRTY